MKSSLENTIIVVICGAAFTTYQSLPESYNRFHATKASIENLGSLLSESDGETSKKLTVCVDPGHSGTDGG